MSGVLVTGATGFLGSHVLASLAAAGLHAVGMGRDEAGVDALREAGHTMVSHDLASPIDPAHAALAEVDAVIHCAALSSPFGRREDFLRANVTATQNLVDFARRRPVRRFVHVSTASVYFAYRDQIGVREDCTLPPPVNDYARTKRQAETIVLASREIGPVVLRPRGIYGAGDRALLPRLLGFARRRPLPLFRDGKAAIDLTHVDDVTGSVLAALASGSDVEGEIFNVSGGEILPVRNIAGRACARAGIAARWRSAPLGPAMLAAGVMEAAARWLPGSPEPPVTRYGLGLFAYAQGLDISKAGQRLGWRPKVSFEEGLDRTFGRAA